MTHTSTVAELDAAAVEIAQYLGISVPHPRQPTHCPDLERGQQLGAPGVDPPVEIGDRVAVRIDDRVPQPLGDALDQIVGGGAAQHLGLVLDLVPDIVERFHQERLDESPAAYDAQGELDACRTQRDRRVGAVAGESVERAGSQKRTVGISPPSTRIVSPVTAPVSLELKKTTTFATSSDSMRRPMTSSAWARRSISS